MQSTSQHTESTFAGWPAQTTGQTDSSTTQPPTSTSKTGATQPPAFTSEPARPTTLQPSALTVNLPAPPSTSSHATTATSNMANLPAPAISYTCTELLQGHHIPSYTWVLLLKAQLQDDAAAWWRDYGEFVTTWEQFRDRLQPVERFIRQKLQLQQRLGTNLAEDEVIALLIGQLSSKLRTLVRAAHPTNYEELIMITNDLETDLNSQPKYKPPQPTAPAWPPHREPPPRFNYNQLPQCHYCPAKHFHRDCPELAKKRQGNGDTGETRTPPLQHGK
ncbi:activity-regulated cytoskeleton-associated protein-like [Nilaparvata lugens]|uniref:activity-regulated cytoskeleton-associated protein-like n=1 Tax=Nilaparvata lugens TaxID=108931 RepID=UPI00193DA9EB|nr:activity-regulated cytoskeleton-associated protein-like [Nilaparvata lugens]